MSFGGYRLLTQSGAGRDGVAYRALAPHHEVSTVEVRDLTIARTVPERWSPLIRRLKLAAQLDHPGAAQIVATDLEGEPPYLVIALPDSPALSDGPVPLLAAEALALGRSLADTLAEAHRIGLAHGRIGPRRVWLDDSGQSVLEFTGVETDTAGLVSASIATVEAACRAPEVRRGETPGREADVFALGTLIVWLLTASPELPGTKTAEDLLPGPVGSLIRAMLATDPADRPTALEVSDRLGTQLSDAGNDVRLGADFTATSDGTVGTLAAIAPPVAAGLLSALGPKLGRFRLLDVLGSGGQGVVYRAEDASDGTVVAVKVLRPEWASRPEAARRFRKEARMLAEVNNPHVVNLLEHNQDEGVAYLVMEFVTGQSLDERLKTQGALDEPTALAVASDVARALEDAHGRGIVHRDVKPANILFTDAPDGSQLRVKLSDFGLARHVVDSESLALTAPGAILGTPHYMAPEQSAGRAVDPRTDVYSLGATLFQMLAGRPPFLADSREQLVALHDHEPPPPLRTLSANVSDGVCRVVERALAKAPDDRYPDAGALLRDLERLARGEPTGLPLHPVLPPCDPARVHDYEFRWDLESSPRQLWPFVTNTDRLDRALGFPPVRYAYRPEPGRRARQFADGVKAGMPETWEEHPYEWVEPRRMGVLREYSRGPFHWLVSTVELVARPGGGTTLIHRLRLEPRGWKSRAFSSLGVGVSFKGSLGRVYERIDAALMGKLSTTRSVDPFESTVALTGPRRQRLDARLDTLAASGMDPSALEWLSEILLRGAPQEIARLRPLALANRWGLPVESVLTTFLHAAREGLLVLRWDILCPSCRESCEIADTLRAIREHGTCEACQLDFDLDFAGSIELIFAAHPEVREADTGVYCAGGPAHAPHVLAQVRVAPGERFELELSLPEGAYQLRGPQLPWSARFRVQSSSLPRRAEVDLVRGPDIDWPRSLGTGGQVLTLSNSGSYELVARVERDASRDDALTAARALAFAPFRDLFPGEVLSPGHLVNATAVTLLVTCLDHPEALYESLGDARAFQVIHDHFRLLDDAIRGAGGTVVKTVDEGLVASFRSPEDAVSVALDLHRVLSSHPSTLGLLLRLGVHRGPALIATIDGRLDYFGSASRRVRLLLHPPHSLPGTLLLTSPVSSDPRVATLLSSRGLTATVVDAGADGLLHRLPAGL